MSIDGELPRVSKLCRHQNNSCAIRHVIVVGDINFSDVVAALSPRRKPSAEKSIQQFTHPMNSEQNY